jgi:hypothetical protein
MLVPLMYLITVAQAMIRASSPRTEWNSIFRNTAGIVFLGTPHRGSSTSRIPGFPIRFFLSRPIPPLLLLLRAISPSLVSMATRFNNIWEAPDQFSGIRGSRSIFSFCETKPMYGPKMVIHHSHSLLISTFLTDSYWSDCPQERCDRKMSRRADI